MKRFFQTLALISLVLLPLSEVLGQGITLGDERLRIDLGFFLPAFNTSVRVDSRTHDLGELIDFENDLDFKKDLSLFRIDAYYRVTRRNRIQFAYYRFTRRSTKRLEKQIEFRDTVFPIDISVQSVLKTNIIETNYMYSILQRDYLELAGAIGFHILSIETGISGINGNLAENASITGPLPMIGFDASSPLTPEFMVSSRIQFFAIDVGDFSGSLTNVRVNADYFFHENVGVGLGYSHFDLNVDVEGSKFLGSLQYQYGGFQLFGVFRY